MPMDDEELLARLDKFSGYKPDWDGQGSPVIEPVALENARKLIAAYPDTFTFVAPLAYGSCSLEAYTYDKEHRHGPFLEIEMDTGEGYAWFCGDDESGTFDEWEAGEELTHEELCDAIDKWKVKALESNR